MEDRKRFIQNNRANLHDDLKQMSLENADEGSGYDSLFQQRKQQQEAQYEKQDAEFQNEQAAQQSHQEQIERLYGSSRRNDGRQQPNIKGNYPEDMPDGGRYISNQELYEAMRREQFLTSLSPHELMLQENATMARETERKAAAKTLNKQAANLAKTRANVMAAKVRQQQAPTKKISENPNVRRKNPDERVNVSLVDTSIQEILKKEIVKEDGRILDDSSYKFQKNSNTGDGSDLHEFGISDHYFYIDSNNKELTSRDASGKLIFFLKKLASLDPIENIIEMQITQMLFEKIPSGDENISFFTPPLVVPYYGRNINMLIEEMRVQSVIADKNVNFHFSFRVEDTDTVSPKTRVRLMPENEGLFIFTKPIQSLDTMTIAFFQEQTPLPLNPDIIEGYFQSGRTVAGDVPAINGGTPTIGATTVATGADNAIFWIQTIDNITKDFINGETYTIRFTDVSNIAIYGNTLFGTLQIDSYTPTVEYLTRSEGHLVQYKFMNSLNVPPLVNPVPPFPSPFQTDPNKPYAYFEFTNFAVPIFQGTNFISETPIPSDNSFITPPVPLADIFYKAAISVECRRILFTIRFRTLKDSRTNKITPV